MNDNPASDLAAVEVCIDWQANHVRHRNRRYGERINLRRDIFPGTLERRLPESNGEWVSEEFPPGELVPPWQESNIHTVTQSSLKLQRKNGPPIRLQVGRHYPRYIASDLPDVIAGDLQPMRVTAIEDDRVTLDLNHALACLPLMVSARIDRRLGSTDKQGGRCNDMVMDLLATGAGLEARHSHTAHFFDGRPFQRLDEGDDCAFYAEPRFVQHLDAMAIAQVTDIYAHFVADGMQVLDLMSSWVSHLPESLNLAITGLGMNQEELDKNPQLTDSLVQDLNCKPALPWPDGHFDAAVCTVSIEYLTRPSEVMREVRRVL